MTSYLEALNQICQPVRRRDYPVTLRPMRVLLAAMGHPQTGLKAVVVAGSSGKGTTCYQISHLFRASGLNVGLYTSPHLHSFRERFVYNDQIISEADFVAGTKAVTAAAADLPHHYSTFEQATALALWWYAQQQPDIVVLEIGLGGRWDAVNVVDNVLAVFTWIETEHAAMLGGTLKTVAWHKAGIIQSGGHAVTVKQHTDVYMALQSEARSKHAQLHLTGGCNLPHENAESLLALAAWQNLLERDIIPRRAFAHGLEVDVPRLPGRLEKITLKDRQLLIDGGHTPAAARYLRSEISRLSSISQSVRLIVGLLSDKDAAAYLEVFDLPNYHIVLTRPPSYRATEPDAILGQMQFRYASAQVVTRLNDAFEQVHTAEEKLVAVAGSLRMAAAAREAFGLLPAADLKEARATRLVFDSPAYLAKLSTPLPGTTTPSIRG